jgi:N-methylhydantoinase A
MRDEAEAVVRLGAPDEPLVERRVGYMRYRGQGHEIAVNLPARAYTEDDAETLKAAFETEYAALFGRIIPKLEVEAITFTLALATEQAPPERLPEAALVAGPDPVGERDVFDPGSGSSHTAQIYRRDDFQIGGGISGPALIIEDETTTVVPPSFNAVVNAGSHIVLTRKEG